MKKSIVIFFFILLGCDSTFIKKEDKLDKSTLCKVERFIPTSFGYNLIDITTDTSDVEAPRYLCLYDNNNKFIDGIFIYGSVQNTEKDNIEINKDMSGRIGKGSIGGIKINYTNIKRISQGGGFHGEYIVDSLIYNKNEKTLLIFTRKHKEEANITKDEIENHNNDFINPETTVIPIRNIEFNPFDNSYFSITGWDKSGKYNSTIYYYFSYRKVLINFFNYIEKNGL